MTLAAHLSAAGWLRPSARRDATLLAWLRAHPDSSASEAATALEWSVHGTHRRLLRLECEGQVHAYTTSDEWFNYVVYCAPGGRHAR
jgi:predicted ArsR family transcriptional regulator